MNTVLKSMKKHSEITSQIGKKKEKKAIFTYVRSPLTTLLSILIVIRTIKRILLMMYIINDVKCEACLATEKYHLHYIAIVTTADLHNVAPTSFGG